MTPDPSSSVDATARVIEIDRKWRDSWHYSSPEPWWAADARFLLSFVAALEARVPEHWLRASGSYVALGSWQEARVEQDDTIMFVVARGPLENALTVAQDVAGLVNAAVKNAAARAAQAEQQRDDALAQLEVVRGESERRFQEWKRERDRRWEPIETVPKDRAIVVVTHTGIAYTVVYDFDDYWFARNVGRGLRARELRAWTEMPDGDALTDVPAGQAKG